MQRDENCRRCPLWQLAKTVCVWGRYHGRSPEEFRASERRVMIVGEAPGRTEDTYGSPFIGPAGRLLSQTLAKAGISSYYVTNAVKCFPDAAPKPIHIRSCSSHLEAEISDVRPTHILCLGNTALRRIIGPGNVTEMAGKEIWNERYQCWAMATLHPAAVLRSPGYTPAWEADIFRFAHLVRGGSLPKEPPVEVLLVTTDDQREAIADLLNHKTAVSYDFEAASLPWWHKDFAAHSIALSFDGRTSYVIPLCHDDVPPDIATANSSFVRHLASLLKSSSAIKIAHNAIYDDLVWYRIGGVLPGVQFDTMLAAHLLDENRPKSLKWLGRALLGWPDWGIDHRAQHPLSTLARYNGYDAAASFLLYETFLKELKNDECLFQYFQRLVMPSTRSVQRIAAVGVHISADSLRERTRHIEELCAEVAQKIPTDNPSSTKQIAEWLYEKEGLPVESRTPSGAPSTDEATINRLARRFPQARLVLEHRKYAKYLSTYLRPIADDLSHSFDGRYHPEYRIGRVETGRLSSFFHTLPRDPAIRSLVSAPEGHELISIDFSQIEARLAAWAAAGKPSSWEEAEKVKARMLLAFRDGRDIYKEMASAALKKPISAITKEERLHMGKIPTLACIYRISVEGLQEYAWRGYQVEWTYQQAEKLHRTFYSLWPEIEAWHEREEAYLQARGWTRSALGRIRRIPEAKSEDPALRSSAIKSGINMPIQSLASDITLSALISSDAFLSRTGWGRTVGCIHDALLFEVESKHLRRALPALIYIATSADKPLAVLGLRLPAGLLRCEAAVGPWGEGKTVDCAEAMAAAPLDKQSRA